MKTLTHAPADSRGPAPDGGAGDLAAASPTLEEVRALVTDRVTPSKAGSIRAAALKLEPPMNQELLHYTRPSVWGQPIELFDYIEDLQFWVKDVAGRYCRVNRGWLLNYSIADERDVVGKTDFDFSPAYLADQFRKDDETVLSGRPVLNRIELVGQFDSTANWYVTNKIAIYSDAGEVIGTSGITRRLNPHVETELKVSRMAPVIEHIQRCYEHTITNAELAHLAGLSVSSFERRFRRYFRCSPRQYIKRVRMSKACYALTYTDQSIAEIALQCGFGDQSFFSKEFKKYLGATPGGYRDRHLRKGA